MFTTPPMSVHILKKFSIKNKKILYREQLVYLFVNNVGVVVEIELYFLLK